MSAYPHIVIHPDTWCAVCGKSWTPQDVAVRFAPLQPMICGECVLTAAALVIVEQERRAEDEAARRNT
jgi:hypothetical protein